MKAKYFYDKFLLYLDYKGLPKTKDTNCPREFSIRRKHDKTRIVSFQSDGTIIRRNFATNTVKRLGIKSLPSDDYEICSIYKMYKVCFITNCEDNIGVSLNKLYDAFEKRTIEGYLCLRNFHNAIYTEEPVGAITFTDGDVWVDIRKVEDVEKENVHREVLGYKPIPVMKYIDNNKTLEVVIYCMYNKELTDECIHRTMEKIAYCAKNALGKYEFIDMRMEPEFY